MDFGSISIFDFQFEFSLWRVWRLCQADHVAGTRLVLKALSCFYLSQLRLSATYAHTQALYIPGRVGKAREHKVTCHSHTCKHTCKLGSHVIPYMANTEGFAKEICRRVARRRARED